MWVQSLAGEDLLEKGTATLARILGWRITWTEEPSRLQSTGTRRVGHDGSDLAGTHIPWNTLWKRLLYMQCSGIYSNI